MTQQTFQEIIPYIKIQNSILGFQKFVFKSHQNYQKLFQSIKNCQGDQIANRFNIWRMSMGIIDFKSNWQSKVQIIIKERKSYSDKYNQAFDIIKKDQKKNNVPKNPLMKVMIKPQKSTKEDDQFLKQQIKKDVDRTYQEMEFFQNQKILKLLTNILYIWCKRNPEVSYKQGMNQILASLVYVYFQSADFQSKKPQGYHQAGQQVKQAYQFMNCIAYAQADIYSVFEKVMHIQKQMYKTQTDKNLKGQINPNSKNNTPILLRIIDIKDHKLKMLDLQLFRIIQLQGVQTKSFMLRWIRCMHTRQFTLQNSFLIWDSIFLDYYQSPSCKQKLIFQFIDAMCVAMFVYMRSVILSLQSGSQILQTYQKYPSLKKGQFLQQLIALAWTLCQALRNQPNIKGNSNGNQIIQDIQFKSMNQSPVSSNKNISIQSPSLAKKQLSPQKNLYPDLLSSSSPSPIKKQSQTQISNTKNESSQKVQLIKQQSKNEFPITFQFSQWSQIQNLLKESIKLNEDLQSKRLCNKVLKMFEAKIKQKNN